MSVEVRVGTRPVPAAHAPAGTAIPYGATHVQLPIPQTPIIREYPVPVQP